MKTHSHLLLFLITTLLLLLAFFLSAEVRNIIFGPTQIDTVGHIIGFFGLSWILIAMAKLPMFNTLICLFLYSALTEVGQYYLGFRSGEFADFLADIAGISLFTVLYWIYIVYGKSFFTRK
jgi:VanZ family protein